MKATTSKHCIRTTAGVLLVLFLFASIVNGVYATPDFFQKGDHSSFVEKPASPSQQNSQLPYEEKENEKELELKTEDRAGSHFFLVALVFDSSQLFQYSDFKKLSALHSTVSATCFPIYLTTLSLRI